MKKIFTIITCFIIGLCGAHAQLTQNNNCQGLGLLSEDFQGVSGGNLPAGWLDEDVDGEALWTTWNSFTKGWQTGLIWNSNPLNKFASNISDHVNINNPADDYLIFPLVTLGQGACLSFKSLGSGQFQGATSSVEVRISTTTADAVGMLAKPAITTLTINSDWTDNIIDLSAYEDSTVYIAIRDQSRGYVLCIDDVEIITKENIDIDLTDAVDFSAAPGNVSITGNVANLGVSQVDSFDVHYTVDGGAVQSDRFTMANIPVNYAYAFTHGTPFNSVSGGIYTLKVWIDNVNGGNDDNQFNDTITQTLYISNGITAPRSVMIEEYTGTWCGYCPDGKLEMEAIEASNPNDVFIATAHAGDIMEFAEGAELGGTFQQGYPSAMLDRYRYVGDILAISRNFWQGETALRLNDNAPLAVSISHNYNSTTRMVDVTVDVDFVDYGWGDDLRINLYVVEDDVSGGSDYDQDNYYSSASSAAGGAGHPYYDFGHPYVGYEHPDVLRAVPSTTWGVSGVISSTATPGANFNHTFNNVSIDPSWRENAVTVIAFVTNYKGMYDQAILNTAGVKLTSIPISVEDQVVENIPFEVYPNPVSGLGFVTANFEELTHAKFEVYDLQGRKITLLKEADFTQGAHTVYFDATDVEPGIYFIRMSTENKTINKKVVVTE